jgi:ribosome-associated translation inhibitor RaiA
MQIPLQVTFRHMAHSPALEQLIRERATRLEAVHPGILSCRVTIEQEGRHQRQGTLFNIRVDVHVPGNELAITRERSEDPGVAVRDAFEAAKRSLQSTLDQLRGELKSHADTEQGAKRSRKRAGPLA